MQSVFQKVRRCLGWPAASCSTLCQQPWHWGGGHIVQAHPFLCHQALATRSLKYLQVTLTSWLFKFMLRLFILHSTQQIALYLESHWAVLGSKELFFPSFSPCVAKQKSCGFEGQTLSLRSYAEVNNSLLCDTTFGRSHPSRAWKNIFSLSKPF